MRTTEFNVEFDVSNQTLDVEFAESIQIGESGGGGEDGFSPIANVAQTPDGAIISITDKNGTTQATVHDGKDGEDGYTPKRGVDYWTPEDKAEVKTYVDGQADIIKADIEGLQAQINEEAHFRGYLSSNAKIQALEATPNDFAYSAESGTKWIYDAENGWQDTGTPVPDQLTPASHTTPLINGVASVGTEESYARGDHRHPTDTTRASVEDLNDLKSTIETALDNIIAIQNGNQ